MIAIVGAGIGGLTLAAALATQDIRCVVVERAAELTDDGAGIQISPNAAAELHALGLGDVFATAVRPVVREIRRWRDNTVLSRTALQDPRYGAPYYTLRRSALVGALIAAVRRAHGPSAVRFGRRCVGVRDVGTGAVLHFDDGTALRADAVVGADGLHSAVRGSFARDLPRYSGHLAGRALLPMSEAAPLIATDRVIVWLGPDRHCVAYPIDGGRHLNLVVTAPVAGPPARAVRDPLPGFAGWHPVVRGLAGLAGPVEHRPLFDRPPMPAWHRGRVVLLGDAAHPMLPFTAQGAAQAIEDAATLAGCRLDVARYEALRRSRVERVAESARAGLHVHHLPDGPEQRHRDRALASAPPDALDWLYGHRVAVGRGYRPRSSETNSTRDPMPSFRKT